MTLRFWQWSNRVWTAILLTGSSLFALGVIAWIVSRILEWGQL